MRLDSPTYALKVWDDADGLSWVMERAEELVHDDPRAAEALSQLCHRAANEHDLAAISAQVHYLQARISTDRGDLEAGLRLIEAARDSYRQAGQPTAALRTDLGRMQILDDLGRHTEALALGGHLVAAAEAIGPEAADYALARTVRAHAVDNIGAAYGLIGEHDLALQAYAQAEAEYLELGLAADAARPRANRGVELLALGRARESITDLAQAVDAFLASGDRVFAAKCQGFLAQAHQQLGELFEALEVLSRARHTLEELGATAEAARLQLTMADTYLAIGGWPEARHEAAEAARATTEAGMVHDAAMAHYLLAEAELGAGNLDAADAALGFAAEQFDRVHDRQYAARTRLARAEVAGGQERTAEAAGLAARAIAELAAGGWLVPLASAHLRLADLATDDAAASRSLSAAGELVQQLGLPQLRYQYRLRAARLARRRGDLDEAERLLRLATEDLDRSARGLPDHALRTAYRADRLAAYDELVGVLLDRGGPGDDERARSTAGEAKALTLRDLVSSSVGVGPHLRQQGSELASAYADLGATYQALQDADDPTRRAALVRRADLIEQRVSALRLRNPTSRDDDSPDQSPAPGRAEPEALTCEFHVVGDDLVLFVSGVGPPRTHRIGGAVPALARLLDRLGDQWTRFLLGSVFSERHRGLLLATTHDLLAELYHLLLAPVTDRLGHADVTAVRIIPHALVGQVPFAALFDGRRYLLDYCTITIAPTPGASSPVPPVGRHALVVAVTSQSAPSATREAATVATMLPSAQLLTGAGATAEAFLALAPQHQLIHLACHGVYRDGNPLFSRLRLADRWVTCAEILHLDLRGALVVLSACESGLLGRSAEPVGLGWAFLAAGAAGVVVSQWVVEDDATTTLMGRFHQELIAGHEPAYALRAAQLEVAARQPHPFYWASFTYVTAPGPTARRTL